MGTPYFERVAYREPAVFWVFKERLDTILASIDNMQSMDDIMEIYNIVKYIENIDAIDGMPEQDKHQYRMQLPSLKRKIGEYFSNITANNFDEQIKTMDTNYARDFWCIMCSFKKNAQISHEKFKKYLDENPHHVDDILAQKDLSKQFSDVIYQHLVKQPYAIRFIISHIIFSQLISLQEKKYVYAKSEQVIRCTNDLFSNQMLCFSDDGSLNGYENFCEALLALGKIDKKLLDRNFQQEALQRLISFGAISDMDGFYTINNPQAVVLRHLFDKEVLCYNYCEPLQKILDDLIERGDLSEGKTLFSIPEQQYLDFILNKATYSDGLDLRNKYSHGTTSTNEAKHFENYLEFLKIMVLIIIKINEEFCLKFTEE